MTDDTQAPGTAPPNWIALARDAYTASTTYFDASIRHGIEADLRQAQGQHPMGSKYLADPNKGRSKLFRPKTRATIRKNEAAAATAFFSTNDVVTVTCENDDDQAQMASAAVMTAILQYRLTKSIPWFLTLIGAYQDAQTVGVVASYQHWEYNERKKIDRPVIELIPVENIRFDPAASWTDPVGTSPYVIQLIPMYVSTVKARMSAIDPKTGEPKWKPLPEAIILSATKSYGDTVRIQREGQRTDSKTQTQANNNFAIVWVHRNVIEVDEQDYLYYTLGSEHLLSDPIPLEQAYFHGRRPFVIGSCILETHKLYPSSVPRMTRDVQAEINELANQRIDNVKLAMNKRYFARRNKQVDIRSVTRNVPGSVTLMADVDDVKVVEFNDVTASSYKEQEVLNLDFDDVAGAFSGSSVQSNRKLNETVGGMQMLDAGANQVSGYQLKTFVETWVEPVLRQLVLLEQHYETDEALIALCGNSAQLAQRFGMDAVTDEMLMNEFSLSVNVGMGAVTPQQQVQNFIQAMSALNQILSDGSLMQMGLNVEKVVKELFGKLGYKDGGRFFDLNKQQDPQLQQAQQMIQQLQQQLAGKQMDPKLLEATVAKLNAEAASLAVKDTVQAAQAASLAVKDIVQKAQAVKTGTEAQFSAMQTAEVIAAVPAVAPIADELMRAAGYTVPTPAGVDPGFPQPGATAPGLTAQDVTNKRTGIGFMPPGVPARQAPGMQGQPAPALPAQSTTLNPATPGIGERHGIETTRPDSTIAKAAFANGGMIDRINMSGGAQFKVWADHLNMDGGSIMGTPLAEAQQPAQPRPQPAPLPPLPDQDQEQPTYANGGIVGQALDGYDHLSQQYPTIKLGLDVAPFSNVITSGLDVASDLHKGDYGTAAGDALGLVPGMRAGVGLAKGGMATISKAAHFLSDNRRPIDAAVNAVPEYIGKVQANAAQAPAPGQPVQNPLSAMDAYANGGMITGPGTGTSDSVAAVAEGQPMAVSNGEFLVPAAVVQALGQDFFEKLVEHYHTETGKTGSVMPQSDAPIGMQNGDFIMPADVVAALGQDFFDKLIEQYGGAQQ